MQIAALPTPPENRPDRRYSQHPCCCWIGGHFTEPNEQNTQQSPELGRRIALQLLHS